MSDRTTQATTASPSAPFRLELDPSAMSYAIGTRSSNSSSRAAKRKRVRLGKRHACPRGGETATALRAVESDDVGKATPSVISDAVMGAAGCDLAQHDCTKRKNSANEVASLRERVARERTKFVAREKELRAKIEAEGKRRKESETRIQALRAQLVTANRKQRENDGGERIDALRAELASRDRKEEELDREVWRLSQEVAKQRGMLRSQKNPTREAELQAEIKKLVRLQNKRDMEVEALRAEVAAERQKRQKADAEAQDAFEELTELRDREVLQDERKGTQQGANLREEVDIQIKLRKDVEQRLKVITAELSASRHTCQANAERASKVTRKLQQRCEQLRDERDRALSREKKLSADIEVQVKHREEAAERMNLLEVKLRAEREKHQEQERNAQKLMHELQSARESIQAANVGARERKMALEKEIEGHALARKHFEERVMLLDAERVAKHVEQRKVETKASELLEELNRAHERLQEEKTRATDRESKLMKKIAVHKETHGKCQERMNALEAKTNEERLQRQQDQKALKAATKELNDLREEASQREKGLQNEIETQSKTRREVEERLDTLRVVVRQSVKSRELEAQKLLEKLRFSREQLNAERKAARDSKEAFEKELGRQRELNDQLRVECEALRISAADEREKRQYTEELRQLCFERESLQRELARVRELNSEATLSRGGNARGDVQSEIADAREDVQSEIADARGDDQSEIADARGGVQSEIADTRDGVQSEIADARNDVQSEIADTRGNVRSEVVDARGDVRSEIADARGDAESEIADARGDVQIETADARVIQPNAERELADVCVGEGDAKLRLCADDGVEVLDGDCSTEIKLADEHEQSHEAQPEAGGGILVQGGAQILSGDRFNEADLVVLQQLIHRERERARRLEGSPTRTVARTSALLLGLSAVIALMWVVYDALQVPRPSMAVELPDGFVLQDVPPRILLG